MQRRCHEISNAIERIVLVREAEYAMRRALTFASLAG